MPTATKAWEATGRVALTWSLAIPPLSFTTRAAA